MKSLESRGSPRLRTDLVGAHPLLLEFISLLLSSLQARHLGIQVSFSHQMLQLHDDFDGNVEDPKLRLRLVRLQVVHADGAKLFESLVDVPDPDSFPGVVGVPPHALPLDLLLRRQTLVTALRQTTLSPALLQRCAAAWGRREGLVALAAAKCGIVGASARWTVRLLLMREAAGVGVGGHGGVVGDPEVRVVVGAGPIVTAVSPRIFASVALRDLVVA